MRSLIRRALIYPALGLLLSIGIVQAQTNCAPLMVEALRALDQNCASTGADQACYGFNRLEVDLRDAADSARFAAPADVIAVERLNAIRTTPLDQQLQQWGLALLRLRAQVPNALPGQLVSLMLVGNAALTDRAQADQQPMQAFQLVTSPGGATCAGVPTASLTIQSPRGLQVSFNLNGVDFSMGSTVSVRFDAEGFRLSTLAGRARLGERVVPVGFAVRGRLTETGDFDLDTVSEPFIVEPQEARWSQVVAEFPESLFDDPIDALTPELLQALSAIDFDWLLYLDPHLLTEILNALLEAGVDPLELDDLGLEDFFWLAADFLDDDLLDALERDIDEHGGIIFDLEDQYGVEDDDPILDLEAYYASEAFAEDADFAEILHDLSGWRDEADAAGDQETLNGADASAADQTGAQDAGAAPAADQGAADEGEVDAGSGNG
jgi:hypothetical protein